MKKPLALALTRARSLAAELARLRRLNHPADRIPLPMRSRDRGRLPEKPRS